MLILNDLPGFEKYFLDNVPVEREMAKFETIILFLGALSIKLMCKSTRFVAVYWKRLPYWPIVVVIIKIKVLIVVETYFDTYS